MMRSNKTTFDPITLKYSVVFDGNTIETVVTDKASAIDLWVNEIRSIYGGSPMVVGLDVEWRPHIIRSMSNKSATLQLCVDLKCLIVQLFYVDHIPDCLKNFLLDPNFTYVGVEVGDDIAKLRNEYGLDCSKHADIRDAAKRKWPGRFSRLGLKDLAKEVASLNMVKPRHVVMSNWEARYLTDGQVEYACIDAYASYKIATSSLLRTDIIPMVSAVLHKLNCIRNETPMKIW